MLKKVMSLLINILLTILILIYLILEELVWERIAEPIYRFIHGLKLLQRLEGAIYRLNRYILLAVFLSIFIFEEGLGVVSLAFFGQGQVVLGTVLYAARIPCAAFAFWLFRITQDKLLTFAWFKFCYTTLLTVLNKIKTSAIYINVKTKVLKVKLWLKNSIIGKMVRRIKGFFGFASASS